MRTKTFALLGVGAAALTLAGAAPALAGGYWDAGNPAIYGGGYCPPRYGDRPAQPWGQATPPGYGYDQGPPPGYGDDQGFAPSAFFDDEGGQGGVGAPGYYGADYGGGGFVGGGGPFVGVNVGFDFRDHGRRFLEERQRFNDHERFNQRFSVQQHAFVRQHVVVQQHVVQQRMEQPLHQSYGHAMGGHGRW